MLKRIWRGEIGLGWAYWGVGLGGLYPIIAIIISFVIFMLFASTTKFLPLPMRMFAWQYSPNPSLATALSFVSAMALLIIPSIVIWRSANRSVSKLWRRAAKGAVVFNGVSIVLAPPLLFFALFFSYMQHVLNAPHYENTTELFSEAPSLFKSLTGIDIPKGAKVVHVAYKKQPVMDYEFSKHIIIDATNIDLDAWLKKSRPFGVQLSRSVPKRNLEWNTEGLTCSKLTAKSVCSFVKNPKTTPSIQKRLRLDHVVTLTILEEEKLIWLLDTQW